RVQLAVRFLAEELLDLAADERNTRRATDEDDLVDLRRRQLGVGQRLAHGPERPLDNRRDERLEFRARESFAVQRRLIALGQVPFGANDGLPKLLQRLWRGADTQVGPCAIARVGATAIRLGCAR